MTEVIDLRALARELAARMADDSLLDSDDVAALLKCSPRQVLERYALTPGFPPAIRLRGPESTGWLANIMDAIEEKTASDAHVERLRTISRAMAGKTICALSEACALPVISYVQKFGDELRAHLKGHAK